MDTEAITIEVLKKIALDSNRILAERQRSIDALTLFHESALKALKNISKKTDVGILKERAGFYISRIKEGATLNMNL